MTIEEAIYYLKTYDPESDYSACFKCPYYGSTKVNNNTYICQSNTARKMAIEALKKEKSRRKKRLSKKNEKAKDAVWLSAPWYSYYQELVALFGQDKELAIEFDEDELLNTIYVYGNDEKAYALTQLIPAAKEFGSITVRTRIIPANRRVESDYELLLKAFKDNPVFVTGIKEEMTDMNYILFKKEVVQFFNDQFDDPRGYRSTLYKTIADDVFAGVHDVFFSTDYCCVPVLKEESEKK